MVTFVDGPGTARQGMMLRRAPIFLRVVVDESAGTVDALDQLDDTPSPGESVHVYERQGGLSMGHYCFRGREKGRSGFYPIATYKHRPDVDGEALRGEEAWREWCHGQPQARPKAEAL